MMNPSTQAMDFEVQAFTDSEVNQTFIDIGPSGHPKQAGLRVVVGVVCALSIAGSLLIILSYICFKSRRTKAREILVHISLMDLGVGLANIIGLSVYYDQYYFAAPRRPAPVYIDGLCKTQAFFAGYATLGSVFWTTSLMAYLYFRIVYSQTKLACYFLRFCYIFCYGFPLLISLWLVLTGKLGYSPYDSAGWCSLITKNPLDGGKVDVFVSIFGNDLWMYVAILLIPILYLSVRLFVSNKVKATKKYATENQLWSALHNVDYKFLFIPIIFISLRIWSCIDSWTIFFGVRLDPSYALSEILFYLAGIGDSGQGFANAILFVIFSKNVRESFKRCIKCEQSKQPEQGRDDSAEKGENSKILEPSASSILRESSAGEGQSVSGNAQSSHFYTTYGTLN